MTLYVPTLCSSDRNTYSINYIEKCIWNRRRVPDITLTSIPTHVYIDLEIKYESDMHLDNYEYICKDYESILQTADLRSPPSLALNFS